MTSETCRDEEESKDLVASMIMHQRQDKVPPPVNIHKAPVVPSLKVKRLTENLQNLQNDVAQLNFKKLNQRREFQDEFMDKFDEFSLSWREAIEKERRF